MEVTRTLETSGSLLSLSIKVALDQNEFAVARRTGLLQYRLMTRDGPFTGRDHLSRNMKSAFRVQLGRVKNRWSVALARTSGFVLVDTLSALAGNGIWLLARFGRLLMGRRPTLLSATSGLTIRSRRIEIIREAELFILISLAAVSKALGYCQTEGERILSNVELFAELEGLDFAGAGSAVEDEFEAVRFAADGWSRFHS